MVNARLWRTAQRTLDGLSRRVGDADSSAVAAQATVRVDRYSQRMTDGGHDASNGPRSVGECLDDLHHNIEGMVKAPRPVDQINEMLSSG